MPLIAHPVICSFSKDPDVLSQWRAYANDGTGVAIGFTGNALKSLPAMLLEVEYNREKQLSGMMQTLIAIYLAEAERNHSRGEDFVQMCGQLALFKIAYKNPAFAEEKEVRSVHLLTVKKDNDMPRLEDDGGLVDGKTEVPGQPVKYRTYRDGLIAYIDLPIPLDVTPQPVRELWVGPKNPNWVGNFLYMMSTYGFKDYEIHQSAATYR
ncbi:MAG: DUF2971 domain-containing protein [Pseudolabrys sp.]|nr:DUF2971 domain-containing protein [Pseudolabrys sp.]